jgi:ureidoglycolate dehydrogenase (NAD+)
MEEGPKPGQDGHFVAAIKISAFEDVSRFKSRVDHAIKQIHECRLANGFDRIYAPGEKEYINQANYMSNGIPLNPVTFADLCQTASELGIEVSQI